MPDENSTTISVKYETWKQLNFRKQPGESFDEVIRRLLEDSERLEELNEE